jgi:hypothetical protein
MSDHTSDDTHHRNDLLVWCLMGTTSFTVRLVLFMWSILTEKASESTPGPTLSPGRVTDLRIFEKSEFAVESCVEFVPQNCFHRGEYIRFVRFSINKI